MPRTILLNSGGMGGHPEGVGAIQKHFAGCREVLFIPYAVADHDLAVARMRQLVPGVNFVGIHTLPDPVAAIEKAEGIWVTGGNSFRLVDALHRLGLIEPVRRAVARGVPYGGASAGSNVACPTICTTNDMPIVRAPRSLDAFALVPFQINPHYLPPDAMPADFRGETRDQRIAEFLEENDVPVLAMREGTWLEISGDVMHLRGTAPAVLFVRGQPPRDIRPNTDLSQLLRTTPVFSSPQPPPGLTL